MGNKRLNTLPCLCPFWCALFQCCWVVVFLVFLQHTLVTYSYQGVITFGGCRDDFMVVVSQQREPGVGKKSVEKLVFGMTKPKVRLRCWEKFTV